jgi:hypothetical protein
MEWLFYGLERLAERDTRRAVPCDPARPLSAGVTLPWGIIQVCDMPRPWTLGALDAGRDIHGWNHVEPAVPDLPPGYKGYWKAVCGVSAPGDTSGGLRMSLGNGSERMCPKCDVLMNEQLAAWHERVDQHGE